MRLIFTKNIIIMTFSFLLGNAWGNNAQTTKKPYVEFYPGGGIISDYPGSGKNYANDPEYEFAYKDESGYDIYVKTEMFDFFKEMEKGKNRIQLVFPPQSLLGNSSFNTSFNRKVYSYINDQLKKRNITDEEILHIDSNKEIKNAYLEAEARGETLSLRLPYQQKEGVFKKVLGNLILATQPKLNGLSTEPLQTRYSFSRYNPNRSLSLGAIGGEAFQLIDSVDFEIKKKDGKDTCFQNVKYKSSEEKSYEMEPLICAYNMATEVRWRDENKKRVCVKVISDSTWEVEKLSPADCEDDPTIKEFLILKEDYLTACINNTTCLNIAPVDEVKRITSALVGIVQELEVFELEKKLRAGRQIEFKLPISKAMKELDSLVYKCNALNLESLLKGDDLMQSSASDIGGLLSERIQRDISGIKKGISSIVEDKNKAEKLGNKFVNMYSQCLVDAHRKAKNGQSSYKYDESEDFTDGDIVNCSYRVAAAIDKELYDTLVRLDDESLEAKSHFKSNFSFPDYYKSKCFIPFSNKYMENPKNEPTSYGATDKMVREFDMEDQINRCFKSGTKIRNSYYSNDIQRQKRQAFPNIQLSIYDKMQIENNFEKCNEKGKTTFINCLEGSVNNVYSEIALRSVVVSPEVSAIYDRLPTARDRYLNLTLEDKEIQTCYDKATKNEDLEKCKESVKNFIKEDLNSFTGKAANFHLAPAFALLRAEMAKNTRELEHDISTFHYHSFGDESNTPTAGSSAKAFAYATARESVATMNSFALKLIPKDSGGTMAGRGLYAATDPISTSDYGNTLLKIDLKKGNKYLDLRNQGSAHIGLSFEAYKALRQYGCKIGTGDDLKTEEEREKVRQERRLESRESNSEEGYNDDYRIYTQNKDHVDRAYIEVHKSFFEIDPRCNELFNQVLDDLDIKFLSYSYQNNKMSFCDEDAGQSSSVAFVMLSADFLGNTKFYNNKGLREIATKVHYGEKVSEEERRMAQLMSHLEHDEESKKYWKDNLFQCSNKYPGDENYNRDPDWY